MPDVRRTFPRQRGIRTTARQFLARTLGNPSGSTTQETRVSNNVPSRPLRDEVAVSSRGRDAVMD
jgi:hypothetical protein